ncbi:MAG TPA: enoyl-CoA hydratase-related protein, partial [Chloroflexota bacterium]|nr:enoyl-CoA hydratase-related protein [Chloroflexota bacterium]
MTESSEAELLYRQDGPIAWVTFNRPRARNAMTWAMYDALRAACERVDSDPSVRALVLAGAGEKAFVAGTDISQFQVFETERDGIGYEARVERDVARLEAVTKPTVALIRGFAVGAGA